MREMLRRQMRMQDVMLVGNLMHSITFFASTTIFVIGSLIAVMAAGDKATALINELQIVEPTTKLMWEIKVLLLVVVFVYAFFRLSWAIRQWNYCSVMLGSAPPPEAPADELEPSPVAARMSRPTRRAISTADCAPIISAWRR
jgi:uncharacterized membrane protein